MAPPPPPPLRRGGRAHACWAWCKRIVVDQFLLISYAVAATIAMVAPAPGKAVLGVTVGGWWGGARRRGGGEGAPLAAPPPPPPPRTLLLQFEAYGTVHVINTINIMIVFLISGLALKTDDIKKAFK